MAEDWTELDVLTSLRTIDPPTCLWLDEDYAEKNDEDVLEERSATIRDHYNGIVEYLREEGYQHLVTLKDRLESNLSQVENRLNTWKGRALNTMLQWKAYRERVVDAAASQVDHPSEVDDEFDSLLDTPIGQQWLIEGELNTDSAQNWGVSLKKKKADESPIIPSDLRIKYEVREDSLSRFGLRGKYEEFDSQAFRSFPVRRFTGDKTWRYALDSLKKHVNLARKHLGRASRTLELIQFRVSVVETVLYRFETFGSEEKMTDEEARDVARKSTRGRPSRLEKPEEVMETLDAVCAWLDTNPSPTFKGEGGLVNFAEDRFNFLSEDGTRDRIKETFDALAREYPNLTAPELGTGYNGRDYLDSEKEIRQLRDEYAAQFVEK